MMYKGALTKKMPSQAVTRWTAPWQAWFAGMRPPENDAVTTKIIISLKEFQKIDKDNKRVWLVDVHEDVQPEAKPVRLIDPLPLRGYATYFRRYAVDSVKEASLTGSCVEEMEEEIFKYGKAVISKLKLSIANYAEKNVEVHIVEQWSKISMDVHSIHGITWEELEQDRSWMHQSEDGQPRSVIVTRSISASLDNWTTARPDYSQEKARPEHPIRILLITGRKLDRYETEYSWLRHQYIEDATPSVVQHSLMQVIQHLEDIGCKRSVQLDILRPASKGDLEAFLGEHIPGQKDFDIIQIDMHGVMSESESSLRLPGFRFTSAPKKLPKESEEAFDPFISAEGLSRILCPRTDLLVMNTCNLSGSSDETEQPTGEAGIALIRPFLANGNACISATSYEVGVIPSEIYHMRFYMALLLRGCSGANLQSSFAKAAAEGRRGLRDDKTRHNQAQRDDQYVFWNWCVQPLYDPGHRPTPGLWLWILMLWEGICWYINACLSLRFLADRSESDYRPFQAVHENYDDLQSHIDCAKRWDLPHISIAAMEIEFFLKHDNKHSVLVHPRNNDEVGQWGKITSIMRNMARIWVETNFVLEVRVINIKGIFERTYFGGFCTQLRAFRQGKSRYQRRTSQPEWSWYRTRDQTFRRSPDIKSMLIIEEVQLLTDLGRKELAPDERERARAKRDIEIARRRISRAVRYLQRKYNQEEYYLIATGKIEGALDHSEWLNHLPGKISQAVGDKWSDRLEQVMISEDYVNHQEDTVEAKYSRVTVSKPAAKSGNRRKENGMV